MRTMIDKEYRGSLWRAAALAVGDRSPTGMRSNEVAQPCEDHVNLLPELDYSKYASRSTRANRNELFPSQSTHQPHLTKTSFLQSKMPISIAVWYVVLCNIIAMRRIHLHCRTLKLVPGEPQEIVAPNDIVITNAALGDELADQDSRTSVKLLFRNPVNAGDTDEEDDEDEDSPVQIEDTVLCSLTPGKVRPHFCVYKYPYRFISLQIEQALLNVTLEAEEEYVFEVVGKKCVFGIWRLYFMLISFAVRSTSPATISVCLLLPTLWQHYHLVNVDQGMDQVPYNDDSEPEEDDFDLRDVSSDVEIDPTEMDIIEEDDDEENVGSRCVSVASLRAQRF
jgi:hypothetical protein